MLQFRRAIKYRSMWYVDAVCYLGTESTSFRICPIFCGWKARLANHRRGERSRLTPKRSKRNGGLFDSNVFFFRLPLLRKVQTKSDGSEEKQVIPTLGA